MKAMYRKRLLKWADAIEGINEAGWDMNYFRTLTGPYQVNENQFRAQNMASLEQTFRGERGCGTVACAAGYLPLIFPSKWKYDKNLFPEPRFKTESFGGYRGIKEYFGITQELLERICEPRHYSCGEDDDYISPQMVARRIRSIVDCETARAKGEL